MTGNTCRISSGRKRPPPRDQLTKVLSSGIRRPEISCGRPGSLVAHPRWDGLRGDPGPPLLFIAWSALALASPNGQTAAGGSEAVLGLAAPRGELAREAEPGGTPPPPVRGRRLLTPITPPGGCPPLHPTRQEEKEGGESPAGERPKATRVTPARQQCKAES